MEKQPCGELNLVTIKQAKVLTEMTREEIISYNWKFEGHLLQCKTNDKFTFEKITTTTTTIL